VLWRRKQETPHPPEFSWVLRRDLERQHPYQPGPRAEAAIDLVDALRREAVRLQLRSRDRSKLSAATKAAHDGESEARVSLPALLADALVARGLEHGWPRRPVRALLTAAARALDLPVETLAASVHAHAARDPRLIELSPALAVEAHMRMLRAIAPVRHASLWAHEATGRVRCAQSVGAKGLDRKCRLVARAAFAEDAGDGGFGDGIEVVTVRLWQRPAAALVLQANAGQAERAIAGARVTAAALTPVLERESLLARNAVRERALVQTGERRIMRVGFDLHDGPMQEIVSLAGDVHYLEQLLERDSISRAELAAYVGRLGERLRAADDGLRGLVQSLESPNPQTGSLREALEREISEFAGESNVAVDFAVRGRPWDSTPSQRIAIIRIVQEALSNVREHSGAEQVVVRLTYGPSALALEISDDGHGFDVERALVRAARGGRFGLLGMNERASLLGGSFELTSWPGGPTAISVVLPAWRPVLADPALVGAPTG
jgi:signal transduction histidine kinase